MDFGRASAARAADGLILLPPLPPLAERCAFTAEEFDENLRRRTAGLRERVEQIDPDALGGPADIAIVERLLRPVFRRRIDPAPAGFEHMDDAADHPAVVDPRLAARVGGKMRRNLRKLRVRQPELVQNYRRFLSEAVNHNLLITPRQALPKVLPLTKTPGR